MSLLDSVYLCGLNPLRKNQWLTNNNVASATPSGQPASSSVGNNNVVTMTRRTSEKRINYLKPFQEILSYPLSNQTENIHFTSSSSPLSPTNSSFHHDLSFLLLNKEEEWKSISTGYSHCFLLSNTPNILYFSGTLFTFNAYLTEDISIESNNYFLIENVMKSGQLKKIVFKSKELNENIIQIESGLGHAMILTNFGNMFGIGWNGCGQLALGDLQNRRTFCKTKLPNINSKVVKIACGSDHTVFLTKEGEIYVCGGNNQGQLGINDTDKMRVELPVKVYFQKKMEPIKQIYCGLWFTIFLTSKNRIYVCGDNRYGQLGFEKLRSSYKPIVLSALSQQYNISKISCGAFHTIVLTSDNELFAFGRNHYGQLGIGDQRNRSYPTKIKFFEKNNIVIESIQCGDFHTLFLTDKGEVFSCGWNRYGQLALKDFDDRSIPTKLKLEGTSCRTSSSLKVFCNCVSECTFFVEKKNKRLLWFTNCLVKIAKQEVIPFSDIELLTLSFDW
ncbi:hypothetical protein ABK040_011686 [Willaertia magna]